MFAGASGGAIPKTGQAGDAGRLIPQEPATEKMATNAPGSASGCGLPKVEQAGDAGTLTPQHPATEKIMAAEVARNASGGESFTGEFYNSCLS